MKYNSVMNLTTEIPETTVGPNALETIKEFLPTFLCLLLVLTGLVLTALLLLSCRCNFQLLSCCHCKWHPAAPEVSSDENVPNASALNGPSVMTTSMEGNYQMARVNTAKVMLDSGKKEALWSVE